MAAEDPPRDIPFGLGDVVRILLPSWRVLMAAPMVAGLATLGITFLIPPTFTATTVILPPSQQSSAALSAFAAQLGALTGLAGAAGGAIKTPADQFVAFLRSRNVTDRILTRFDLKTVYDEELTVDARNELLRMVRVTAGKRDGLITIEADDHDPTRAAAIANAMVDELRRINSEFAVGEAAQRRAFFEGQLQSAKDALTKAEEELNASGVSVSTLKTAPQAAVAAVAKLKASITAQEVKIASLQGFVTNDNPDLRQARLELAALRGQLAEAEAGSPEGQDASRYTTHYREFKYREALFELIAKQYELARLDEAREGALIQVIDSAEVPERKSKPKRSVLTVGGALSGMVLATFWLLIRARLRPRARPAA